jgi:hypothetical protein
VRPPRRSRTPGDSAGRLLVELARVLAGKVTASNDARAVAALSGRLAGVMAQLERRAAPGSGSRRPSRLEQLQRPDVAARRERKRAGMRDWRNSDPGYSSNDARHPRNRPPGSDAFTVDPAVVAGMVAAMRSGLAMSRRPQPQRPVARVAPRPGRPQAGHQKSYSERRAAPERPERPRYHTPARPLGAVVGAGGRGRRRRGRVGGRPRLPLVVRPTLAGGR